MSGAGPPTAPTDLRILLVDDDADQRMLVGALLRQRGFRNIVEAVDGDDALRRIVEVRPHLLLLDLNMPGRSGTDVLPELREAAPETQVVVLSNLPRRRLLEPLMRRGAVGFVEKSVDPARLVDEILVAATLSEIARMHVLDLAASTASAGHARNFTRVHLTEADDRLVDDVELLVSELVTNAVLHASGDPRLEIRIRPGVVRLEVYDDDPALPALRAPDDGRPGGRGLRFVEAIASRWGAEPVGAGKVVWFEIDLSGEA